MDAIDFGITEKSFSYVLAPCRQILPQPTFNCKNLQSVVNGKNKHSVLRIMCRQRQAMLERKPRAVAVEKRKDEKLADQNVDKSLGPCEQCHPGTRASFQRKGKSVFPPMHVRL